MTRGGTAAQVMSGVILQGSSAQRPGEDMAELDYEISTLR